MTRGHLLSTYTNFSGKKRPSINYYIFLGKKAIIITSHETQQNDLLSHYNLFLGKLKEKLAVKARVNTDAIILDCAYAPWSSHNTR